MRIRCGGICRACLALLGESLADEDNRRGAGQTHRAKDVERNAPIAGAREEPRPQTRADELAEAQCALDESDRDGARAGIESADGDHQCDVLHRFAHSRHGAVDRHVEEAERRRGQKGETGIDEDPDDHRALARQTVEHIAGADAADAKAQEINRRQESALGEREAVFRVERAQHDREDHPVGGVHDVGRAANRKERRAYACAHARVGVPLPLRGSQGREGRCPKLIPEVSPLTLFSNREEGGFYRFCSNAVSIAFRNRAASMPVTTR